MRRGALKSWSPVLRVGGAGGWRAAVCGDLGASGAFGRTLHTSCLRSCPPEPSASLRESFTVLPTVVGNRKLTPASRNRLEKGAEGHAEGHTGFHAVLTDVDPRLVPASCGGLRAQSCSASSFSVNSFISSCRLRPCRVLSVVLRICSEGNPVPDLVGSSLLRDNGQKQNQEINIQSTLVVLI